MLAPLCKDSEPCGEASDTWVSALASPSALSCPPVSVCLLLCKLDLKMALIHAQ